MRKETRSNYTNIANDVFDDQNGLSFRARGILCYLLSKPPDWDIRIEQMSRLGPEGQDALTTAMRELVAAGFVMRVRERNEKGQLKTITLISDYPRYADVWTVEERLRGYEGGKTEGDETEGSETEGSDSNGSVERQSVEGGVIINTVLPITVNKKAAAAAPDAKGRNVSEFALAYERIWGHQVESSYIGAKIDEWATRVPLATWEYALQESFKAGKRYWKYLEAILNRVEVEGIGDKEAKPAAPEAKSGVVDWSWDTLVEPDWKEQMKDWVDGKPPRHGPPPKTNRSKPGRLTFLREDSDHE
jgi:hypothetical protein